MPEASMAFPKLPRCLITLVLLLAWNQKMPSKKFFLLLSLLCLCALPAYALKTNFLDDNPIHKAEKLLIAGKSMEALTTLQQAPGFYETDISAWIEKNAATLDPLFLILLAEKKFNYNHQEALRWYLTGHLRARYDVARCSDPSSGSALSLMMASVAPQTARYLTQNRDELVKAGKPVLQWDQEHPPRNTTQWICGLSSVPKAKWPDIRTDVRTSFQQAFNLVGNQETTLTKLKDQKIFLPHGELNQMVQGQLFPIPGNKLLLLNQSAVTEIYDLQTGQSTPTEITFPYWTHDHSFTQLQDGHILRAGGQRDSYEKDLVVYVLDPSTKMAVNAGTLKVHRIYHSSTLLKDGKVLIVGGITGQFNWEPRKKVTLPSGEETWVKGEKVIIAPPTDQAELFDPQTQTSQLVGAINVPRVHHTSVLLPDGRVMILGGTLTGRDQQTRPASDTQIIELYTPASKDFKVLGSLQNAYDRPLATLLSDGKVLLTGGKIPNSKKETAAELIDPNTGIIKVLPNTKGLRENGAASVVLPSGNVFFFGPDAYGEGTSSAEMFDPTTETFESVATIPNQRLNPQLHLTQEGKVLIFFGSKEVLQFDPEAWKHSQE